MKVGLENIVSELWIVSGQSCAPPRVIIRVLFPNQSSPFLGQKLNYAYVKRNCIHFKVPESQRKKNNWTLCAICPVLPWVFLAVSGICKR